MKMKVNLQDLENLDQTTLFTVLPHVPVDLCFFIRGWLDRGRRVGHCSKAAM